MDRPDPWKKAAGVLFLLLGGGALLIPMPEMSDWERSLLDMLHAPLFAVTTWMVAAWLGGPRASWRVALPVLLLFVGVGVASEFAQAAVGRTASRKDMIADACGAGVGAIWAMASPLRGWRRAVWPAAGTSFLLGVAWQPPLTVLSDVVAQRFEGPQLASFESSRELIRWSGGDADWRRSRQHATSGRWSLHVTLRPAHYPGVTLRRVKPDWSGYQALAFDIHVDQPLAIYAQVQDAEHNGHYRDRFHRRLELSPGDHSVRIPLEKVARTPSGRRLDLRRITRVQFFAVDLAEPRELHLDHVRLE